MISRTADAVRSKASEAARASKAPTMHIKANKSLTCTNKKVCDKWVRMWVSGGRERLTVSSWAVRSSTATAHPSFQLIQQKPETKEKYSGKHVEGVIKSVRLLAV